MTVVRFTTRREGSVQKPAARARVKKKIRKANPTGHIMRIQEFARLVGREVHTIRNWLWRGIITSDKYQGKVYINIYVARGELQQAINYECWGKIPPPPNIAATRDSVFTTVKARKAGRNSPKSVSQ